MMRGNDNSTNSAAFELNDIRVALALLTRLPLPYPPIDANRSAAMAAWAYPLVGLFVGLLMIVTINVAMALGLSASVATLLAVMAAIIATGAMHEDGLADCADGFWGGWTSERRLEIMKDSQIGTYGVLALLVSFGLRWQLITALIEANALIALLPAAIASRSVMVWMMHHLPHARPSGLSQQTGTPSNSATLVALSIGLGALVLCIGAHAFVAILAAGGCALGLSKLAKSKIGGQTGDVLGATQSVIEITVLLAAAGLVYNS
jgi:adenosylcobinamide-GDP ribazoletransferase